MKLRLALISTVVILTVVSYGLTHNQAHLTKTAKASQVDYIDRSVAQHVDRSVAQHIDRSLTQHIDRSVAQHIDRSLTQHIDRSVAHHIDLNVAHHIDLNVACNIDLNNLNETSHANLNHRVDDYNLTDAHRLNRPNFENSARANLLDPAETNSLNQFR